MLVDDQATITCVLHGLLGLDVLVDVMSFIHLL
jgi:hypothetical protein